MTLFVLLGLFYLDRHEFVVYVIDLLTRKAASSELLYETDQVIPTEHIAAPERYMQCGFV